MPNNSIFAALICSATLLAGCTESSTPDYFPITIGQPDAAPDPNQTQPTENQQQPISSLRSTDLYNGLVSWKIDGLNIELVEPPSADISDSQLVFRAATDDRDIVCVVRIQYLDETIGVTTQFTQFTRNPDISYITVDDFDAQNGLAKKYLSSYTQEDGELVNSMGHFYYFPAEQVTYNITTSFNLKCNTFANQFAQHEQRMSTIMETIEFRVAEELTNSVNEDWSGFRSVVSDDYSRLRFRNLGDEELEVFWIDFDGLRVSNGQVNPGTWLSIGTYNGHLFVVVNAAGSIVGQFRATAEDSTAIFR